MERRLYQTRQRVRAVKVQQKYDEIFSSVSEKIRHQFDVIRKRYISETATVPEKRTIKQKRRRLASTSCRSQYLLELEKRERIPSGCSRSSSFSETNDEAESSDACESGDSLQPPLTPQRKSGNFVCSSCSSEFQRHMQLHRHLITQHSSVACPACLLSWRVLRARHVCPKCDEVITSVRLEQHMKAEHGAEKKRVGSLLQCSLCTRSFTSLSDVLIHERRVHRCGLLPGKKPTRDYPCRTCGMRFESRYQRDNHFTIHFQSVLQTVWNNIERVQMQNPDELLANQCPLCLLVMCSRKSFRTHVIHRHLIQEESALEKLVGPTAVKEEVDSLRDHIKMEIEELGVHPTKEVKLEAADVERRHENAFRNSVDAMTAHVVQEVMEHVSDPGLSVIKQEI